jgi:two-component system response regulator FixJ
MPEMDGLQVQAAMLDRGIAMPVIVLTGHGDVAVAVQAMKQGAVDFIEKPFERAVLLDAVKRGFARLESANVAALEASEAKLRLAVLTSREMEILEVWPKAIPIKQSPTIWVVHHERLRCIAPA